MSEKLSREELEKMAREICELDSDPLEKLGPFRKPRDPSKNLPKKLTNYTIVVESSVAWASRKAYLNLLKRFLAKEIDGITFQSEFISLRGQNMSKVSEICEKIEDGLKPIPDFYYTSKADDFNSELVDLFDPVEAFDPNIDDSYWTGIVFSENQLRSVIRETYLPILQKCCDFKD